MTDHSAFLLGLRRWLAKGAAEEPRPSPGPNKPGKPFVGPPGDPSWQSFAQWAFAGLLVLAVLAVKIYSDGAKGELRDMNLPFLLAAVIALSAAGVHIYTFEALIWPKLNADCFPSTPFAAANVLKNLFRRVWHIYTVSWLLTAGLLGFVTFGSIIPYANLLVLLAIGYWAVIVVTIFFVAALCLEPGESYLKTMAASAQWMVILVMIGLMYWGTLR